MFYLAFLVTFYRCQGCCHKVAVVVFEEVVEHER